MKSPVEADISQFLKDDLRDDRTFSDGLLLFIGLVNIKRARASLTAFAASRFPLFGFA